MTTLAGVETAIPATKSFTTQLAVLSSLTLDLAKRRGVMSSEAVQLHTAALDRLPALMERALPAWEQAIHVLAPSLVQASALLYLGCGIHYAIAREGALKLKESAYMNADGLPAGEIRHGPNALVSPQTPLIILATHDPADAEAMLRYGKVLQLMETMQGQGARIIALATEGDDTVAGLAETCLFIPPAADLLAPMLEVVPLQLLAYTLAVMRGVDVDRPRNLVKAVVTE